MCAYHDNKPHIHAQHRKFKLKFVCLIFGIWGCKIIQLNMHKCHKIHSLCMQMPMINLLNPIIDRVGMSQIDRDQFMNFIYIQFKIISCKIFSIVVDASCEGVNEG